MATAAIRIENKAEAIAQRKSEAIIEPVRIPTKIQRKSSDPNGSTRSALIRSETRIQPALIISSTHDPAEHEADRVARHVMQMPAPNVGKSSSSALRRSPLIAQRKARGSGQSPMTAPAAVDARIRAAASGGFVLPPKVRMYLEPRFRADFSGVRIHNDAQSAQLSTAIGARAFAYGRHVFFNQGQYNPDSAEGMELIAHELTHTIQQGAAEQGNANVHRKAEANAAPHVSQRTGEQASRFGVSDVLNFFADAANAIPGYRMFTILIGVNPINMSAVEASAANILRAIVEFLPGGNIITRVLDSYGVFDRVGSWIENQLKSLGITGPAIKAALNQFIDSLGFSDLFSLGSVWDRAKAIFATPITRIITFARGLFAEILRFIREAVLRPLGALASQTRAYPLLKAVLGYDPVTGEAVPRNAETIIGGFMTLIGQEELWGNIQRSNAIPRAWAWFQGAMSGMVALVTSIPTRFMDALRGLEIMDFVVLPSAFFKLARVFATFVGDFISWAGGTVLTLLEIILEVVAPAVIPYLKKAGSAFSTIIRDPIRFVRTLVRAGIQGFRQFSTNFLRHLQASLVGWLTGAMSGANIYIPQSMNLRELLKFVLSILGLTWQNIRTKLVREVGETAVVALETGFDIIRTLITEGPAAAWQQIVEAIGNLRQMAIDAIMDFVKSRVVEAAITRLLSMLNPAGAFIQAIIAIYNTVMFFVERIRQIAQVAAAFIDGISAIASGNIAPAADKVETTMAGLLTLVISFLARIAGLGRVADAVTNLINRIRAPIDRALDRVARWIVTRARALGRLVMRGVRAGVAAVTTWWRERRRLRLADGSEHTLSFRGTGSTARLILASVEKPVEEHLANAIADTSNPAAMRASAQAALTFFTTNLRAPLTEAQVASLPANLNRFVTLLGAISAVSSADLRVTPTTDWNGPRRAFIGPLTNRTSRGGSESSGIMGGPWDLLTARRMTTSGQRWVRMHMISAQYGGINAHTNFIPAPSATNTGGVVRGFENTVQETLYGRDSGGVIRDVESPFKASATRQAAIWLETRSIGFYPAASGADGSPLYGAGVFAREAQFSVGIYSRTASDWVRNPTATHSVTVPIDPPDFAGTLVPNINSAGPSAIAAAATISEYYASEIVRVRGSTSFTNDVRFIDRMLGRRADDGRRSTDPFVTAVIKVVDATNAGLMTWR
jgi:Domain of unknown function (DUF4157)